MSWLIEAGRGKGDDDEGCRPHVRRDGRVQVVCVDSSWAPSRAVAWQLRDCIGFRTQRLSSERSETQRLSSDLLVPQQRDCFVGFTSSKILNKQNSESPLFGRARHVFFFLNSSHIIFILFVDYFPPFPSALTLTICSARPALPIHSPASPTAPTPHWANRSRLLPVSRPPPCCQSTGAERLRGRGLPRLDSLRTSRRQRAP